MQTLSLMKLKKKHQEGTCSFPTCCSEAIEVTSPTNLKDAKSKMHPVPCRMTGPSREIIKWGCWMWQNHVPLQLFQVGWTSGGPWARPGGSGDGRNPKWSKQRHIQSSIHHWLAQQWVESRPSQGSQWFPQFQLSKDMSFFLAKRQKMRHLRSTTCQKPCTTLQHVFSYIGHP